MILQIRLQETVALTFHHIASIIYSHMAIFVGRVDLIQDSSIKAIQNLNHRLFLIAFPNKWKNTLFMMQDYKDILKRSHAPGQHTY